MVDFIAVAQQTPFRTYESATSHLEETARRAGVTHLSYWCLQFVDGIPDHVVWVSTYDPLYMSQYMAKFTPMGDPVLEMVMDDKVVIDWTEWLSHDGVSADIWEIAKPYNISKFGISLPLKSEGQDKVIFSVNTESDDETWPAQRGVIVQRFRPFAQEFHIRMRPMIAARQKGVSVYSF
jgi:Autoinducer binding domain